MRRPRVFRLAASWAVQFALDGRLTVWRTGKHADALAFALNLAALAGRGLRRD
jgi:hypothetical protein